jgi:hypothetical protein
MKKQVVRLVEEESCQACGRGKLSGLQKRQVVRLAEELGCQLVEEEKWSLLCNARGTFATM